jgi:hypothetical protein
MKTFRFFAVLLAVSLLSAQSTGRRKSALPDPPKKDVPYIIHAGNLVETEIGQAKQESRKDEVAYAIPGPGSSVRTPLAGPEFLFESETISPDRLQLYKLESKNGRREVTVLRKKKPVAKPIRLSVFQVQGKVFKIRVDDSLASGEYALSPDGSDTVFCFAIQ